MQAIHENTGNHRKSASTSKKTATMPSVWFFLVLASGMAAVASGFTSLPLMSPSPSSTLGRSAAIETSLSAATKNYPPMSRDEVQAMMDTVPVYAVTEPNQEGLVLVKEKNNPNDIAYFFFSPEAANTVFSPLKKKQQTGQESGGEWSVSAYPLGLVWFELINDPEQQGQGVEYRLLPDPEDLIGAQNLLREQQKQSGVPNPKINELFRSPFNDIPIFVDQFLRVTAQAATEGEGNGDRKNLERVPLYIGLKDLMDTCNKAIKASSGEYKAAMSAIDLRDLIDEMTREGGNLNDYRKAVLVPPTPEAQNNSENENNSDDAKKSSPSSSPTGSDPFNWEGKQNMYGKALEDGEEIATPTATNDWSD
jgi:hypothetical protein